MHWSSFPILLLLLEGQQSSTATLNVLHSFKVPKYDTSSATQRSSDYIGKNIAIIDVDYWKDKESKAEKIFVTTPRQKSGTPASLSIVKYEGKNESVLQPYPSWEKNQPNCNSIVSAFRTQVDSCDRIWVIDSGVINSATGNFTRICPPKIWIFDLKTDKLLSSHEISNNVLKIDSLLTTIVVDIRDKKCQESFAYIADVMTFQIIVFNQKEGTFWQFRDKLLYPYPLDGIFNINGVSFDLMDGVLGLALGPLVRGERLLYLHSLASRRESFVRTSVLRNSTLAGDVGSASQHFQVLDGIRGSQSAAEAMTEYGVLFFGQVEDNSLYCWPSSTSFKNKNVKRLAKDDKILQFISGMKVIGSNLWLISSRLQNFIVDQVNENEVNYRIIRASIEQLTRQTKCYPRPRETGFSALNDFENDSFSPRITSPDSDLESTSRGSNFKSSYQ